MLPPLTIIALGLSCLAALGGLWSVFLPRFGVGLLYYRRELLFGLAIAAGTLALAGGSANPTAGSLTGALLVLLGLAAGIYLTPARVLPEIDAPAVGVGVDTASHRRILGAVVQEAARAWSLALLMRHGVINDSVGRQHVCATWCPVARTGVVYAALFRHSRLTFEVAGVWRRNLVLRDRETGTLWQQATGHALMGPLEGARLQRLESTLSTTRAWVRDHPCAPVADEEQTWAGLLPASLSTSLLHWLRPVLRRSGLSPVDKRLPADTDVVGMVVDGHAFALPVHAIGPADHELRVTNVFVAGTALAVIHAAAAHQILVLTRPYAGLILAPAGNALIEADPVDPTRPPHRWSVNGRPLSADAPALAAYPHEQMAWTSWSEFHPETAILQSRTKVNERP